MGLNDNSKGSETITKAAAGADAIYRLEKTKRVCAIAAIVFFIIQSLNMAGFENYAVLALILGVIVFALQYANAKKEIIRIENDYDI